MASNYPLISETSIKERFGGSTVGRGKRYQVQGMVLKIQWAEQNKELTGMVAGNAHEPYRVVVELRSPHAALPWRVDGSRCTCPVGFNCKHAVALCFEAIKMAESSGSPGVIFPRPRQVPLTNGGGSRSREPDWRMALEKLVEEEATESITPVPIALSVDLRVPRQAYNRHFALPEEQQVDVADLADGTGFIAKLRPLRKSVAGNWVKGQISWATFEHLYSPSSGINKEQFLLLSQLCALHSGTIRSMHNQLEMDTFYWNSVEFWELLRRAVDAGLPLIGQGQVNQVEIAEPAEYLMDLSRPEKELLLTPRVMWKGSVMEVPRPLGYSAVVVAEDVSTTAKKLMDVQLIPLNKALTRTTMNVLQDADSIRVPRAEEQEFFDNFYPVLHNNTAVISSDKSAELPEVQKSILELSVRFTEPGSKEKRGDSLHLAWQWRRTKFGNPIEHQQFVVAQVQEIFPDATAESVQHFFGAEALRIAEHVLDQLHALEYVDVIFENDRPAYQELHGEPFVSISTEQEDNDWFDLNFDIAIDDVKVPFTDVFVALARDEDFVLLADGSYFSLDHPAFVRLRELLKEAQDIEEWTSKSQRVHRSNSGLFNDLQELADDWVPDAALESWMQTVQELSTLTELPKAEVPESLQATLRPYQEDGFRWLALLHDLGLGGVLADDMGLGKTIQTLALMAHARKEHRENSGFLVVAPSSVVSVWRDEAARFLPDLKVVVLDKTAAKRKTPVPSDADIVITSYAIARIDEQIFASSSWQGLIVDEAQFVKNHTTRTFRAILGIAQQAQFRLAITGTPMENSLSDLWSLCALTAPGLFPHFKEFKAQFITPIEADPSAELAAERMRQLRRRIAPFMLRRAKEQVATDLPDKIENTVVLPLQPAHRKLYDAVLQRERKKVLKLLDQDLDSNRMTIFRSLTLLRMLALDPQIVDEDNAAIPSTKLEDLLERLEIIVGAKNHQVIVFSQFTSFLGRVAERLDGAGISFSYLDGATRDRSDAIKRFREEGASVFLISLKAGGFGLTLTEADYVFLLDPWWNPAAEKQAIDRAHRIGQRNNVMVYRMVSEGTIEEKVLQLQKRKAALFHALTTGTGTAAAGLTADDLRALFDTH
ncbi:DEAD/DEAH box helicase [uncultured Corynebacterium sp.]|uniref:DEAD/DEAH box helicase n=1 Tax=uncultured Corynebacterium sp. TaxID=159447 RepID=UPI0025CF9BC7|nr:DEAD/DEAH box helicase [uncultured Corynebacterium sp.]